MPKAPSNPRHQQTQPIQLRWITNKRHQYKDDEGCDDNDTYDKKAGSNARGYICLVAGSAHQQELPGSCFPSGDNLGNQILVAFPPTWPRTRLPWPIPVQCRLAPSASTARPSVRSGRRSSRLQPGPGRTSRKATVRYTWSSTRGHERVTFNPFF